MSKYCQRECPEGETLCCICCAKVEQCDEKCDDMDLYEAVDERDDGIDLYNLDRDYLMED